jgi:hypothetical protein
MSRAAKVMSIGVLPLLAAALQKFRGEGVSALDDLENELRRLLEWIHHDRKERWEHELRLAQENLTQTRILLQQATTMRSVTGHQAGCADERKAVERAKRRVENALRKCEAVRHWIVALDRAADEFRRSRTQFATWIDVDLARGVASLNEMSETLVTYTTMKPVDKTKADTEPAASEDAENADKSVGEGTAASESSSPSSQPVAAGVKEATP